MFLFPHFFITFICTNEYPLETVTRFFIRDYHLLTSVATSLASNLVFMLGHLGCAKKLHTLLLNGILHAPANFFDLIPAVSVMTFVHWMNRRCAH